MAHSTFPADVSKIRIMRALVVKDWRLFRLPIIGLIIAGAASFFYDVGVSLYLEATAPNSQQHLIHSTVLVFAVQNAAELAGFLTLLLATTFGGVAIAGERSERTAEFMAILPVGRGRIVLSKLISAGSVLMAFMLFYAIIFAVTFHFSESWTRQSIGDYAVPVWKVQMACAVSFFGVAWLIGSFTASATISASVSIATTLGALAWMSLRMEAERSPRYGGIAQRHDQLAIVAFSLGLSCLIAGTIYYLRRIAP